MPAVGFAGPGDGGPMKFAVPSMVYIELVRLCAAVSAMMPVVVGFVVWPKSTPPEPRALLAAICTKPFCMMKLPAIPELLAESSRVPVPSFSRPASVAPLIGTLTFKTGLVLANSGALTVHWR